MMDLTLLLLHPPLPYRGVEWWWSEFTGSEGSEHELERRWSNPL
jgi:hypothetical protein